MDHLPAGVDAGVGAPGADQRDGRAPAARWRALPRACPGRCAGPAGSPSRGSRSRRRTGRSAAARSLILGAAHPASVMLGRDQPRDRAGLDRALRLPARRVRALRPRLRPAHGDHLRGRRPPGEAAPGRRPPARAHVVLRLRAARHHADPDVREVAASWCRPRSGSWSAHWDRFLADAPSLRAGLATGKYDAYLLMPRGVRDEEFHTAITELLSDWGSTVADPEVPTVRLVSPTRRRADAGDPRVPRPDGHAEPHLRPGLGGRPRDRGAATPASRRTRWSTRPYRDVGAPSSVREVAASIYGRPEDVDIDTVVDLCIVGAGPAGLAAAVYGVVRGPRHGGGRGRGDRRPGRHQLDDPQLPRLPARHLRHAARPARAQPGDPVRHPVLHRVGGHLLRRRASTATTTSSAPTAGRSTPGRSWSPPASRYRKLGIEPLERLVGQGVFYGSAMSAARELEGQDVVVVGGGNSAGQAAIHLARFARSVTILVRRAGLEETMSQYLVNEIEWNPRVVGAGRTARSCDGGGEGRLEWLDVRDTVGAAPSSGWRSAACSSCSAPSRTATGCRRRSPATSAASCSPAATSPPRSGGDGLPPANLATTVPGVFAVGDIRAGSMKRVAAASGEGASVVPLVHTWLDRVTFSTQGLTTRATAVVPFYSTNQLRNDDDRPALPGLLRTERPDPARHGRPAHRR